MKSLEELKVLLFSEINQSISEIKSANEIYYYNQIMGDTSILLTSILEEHLLMREDWDSDKWLDDCLIMKVNITNQDKVICIWGIIIFGKNNTTEEWTYPLYFEADISSNKKYKFFFGDKNQPEITYEEFRDNREFWINDNRKWKYIIRS